MSLKIDAMTVICLHEQDMVAIGGLRLLNRLYCAKNWHKSRKLSQKWLRRRENRERGGFRDTAATEFWDLATS